jgi:hypothetical protein
MAGPKFTGAVQVHAEPAPGLPTTFTDWVVAQRSDFGVTLAFHVLDLPLLQTPEEREAFAKNPSVAAHCTARVIMPEIQARRLLASLRDLFGPTGEGE